MRVGTKILKNMYSELGGREKMWQKQKFRTGLGEGCRCLTVIWTSPFPLAFWTSFSFPFSLNGEETHCKVVVLFY